MTTTDTRSADRDTFEGFTVALATADNASSSYYNYCRLELTLADEGYTFKQLKAAERHLRGIRGVTNVERFENGDSWQINLIFGSDHATDSDRNDRTAFMDTLSPQYRGTATASAAIARNAAGDHTGTTVRLEVTGIEDLPSGDDIVDSVENVIRARVTAGRIVFTLGNPNKNQIDATTAAVAELLRVSLSGKVSVQDAKPENDLLPVHDYKAPTAA